MTFKVAMQLQLRFICDTTSRALDWMELYISVQHPSTFMYFLYFCFMYQGIERRGVLKIWRIAVV
jgi:hypothetical protein